MKKFIALILTISIIMMTGVVVFAERPVKLYIGGEKYFLEKISYGNFAFYRDTIPTDVAPKIVNGRTMLPVRVVFEAIGAKVGWNDATQTVTATKGDTVVKLTIGSNIMTVNGTEKIIDVPAYVENGRTMVPVRACAEAFNLAVEWDDATHTVKVRKEVQVISEEYTAGGELATKYTYDNNGNLVYEEDLLSGGWIRYTYDSKDRLIRSEALDSAEDKYISTYEIIYDERGNLVKFGGTGTSTYYCKYDENDNLIYKENQAKNWTKYEYITDENGTEKILYENHIGDAGCYQIYFGPEYTEFCFIGNYEKQMMKEEVSLITYDRKGTRTADEYFSDGEGSKTTYTNEYDENGKLTGHYMDGTSTWQKYEYDENGNLIRETTSWGEDTIYEYDENGKLIKSTSSDGVVTTYITVVR